MTGGRVSSTTPELRLPPPMYSLGAVPVLGLTIAAIMWLEGQGALGTRWLFVGDGETVLSAGTFGVLIYGFMCALTLRGRVVHGYGGWIRFHMSSCAVMYAMVLIALAEFSRAPETRGSLGMAVVVVVGIVAAWGIVVHASIVVWLAFRARLNHRNGYGS